VAVRQGGRRQRPGQRQFAVDERGKGRLNTRCKSKTMKTKICLLGFFALVTLAIAAPHTWTFQKGGTFEGDYYSSGTTAVVVRKNGTNYIFKFADLSTNDLAYVAKMQAAQKQARLDAEVKQMQQAGMVEFTADLIDNFPEKVRSKTGWMDANFYGFDKYAGRSSEIDLGFDVEDSLGKSYRHCVACKTLHGPNWPYDQGQNDRPNPLLNVISNLKQGDKVRLHGSVNDRGPLSDDYTQLFFYVDRVEIIETAAEKKAKEQAAQNP
jgi:hypothetical protein